MRGSTRAPWHIDRSIPYVQGTTVQGNPCKPHMTKRRIALLCRAVCARGPRASPCVKLYVRDARGERQTLFLDFRAQHLRATARFSIGRDAGRCTV